MTDLELIKAACVAANPDKDWQHWETPDRLVDTSPRLADVLLAIGEKLPKTEYLVDARGFVLSYSTLSVAEPSVSWNLRADNLDDQSLECLAFIANLLR